MRLDGLSLSLGILLIGPALVGLFYIVAYLKNLNRYPIPKYLPREDEVYWVRLMGNPLRLWMLKKSGPGIVCLNWDMGEFIISPESISIYNTKPMMSDVLLAPKKWGGYHALIITGINFVGGRYQVTAVYLGEYRNGKIHSRRVNSSNISV